MKLAKHNEKTYMEVKEFLKESNRCAIVQATGTGKSSIIKKLLLDYEGSEKILIAPDDRIIDQFDYYGLPENTHTIRYRDVKEFLLTQSDEFFEKAKLIACDELHRIGAKTWERPFEKLCKLCKNAKIVGATATPRRTDQTLEDDMVDIHFEGNRAGNISLYDAIINGILPTPIYVASIYTLNEEINKRKALLESNKRLDEIQKTKLRQSLENIKVDWERMGSLDLTFDRYLKPLKFRDKDAKILIFCKNKTHLNQVRKNLDYKFKEIFKGTDLKIKEFHSSTDNSGYEDFCKSQENNPNNKVVKILYTVNKFNEGIHVNDLDAVILLRETTSEILYYQQIGRVLSANGNENPLILDLVNNFDSLKQCKIWQDIDQYYQNNFDNLNFDTFNDGKKIVHFYNYTEDAISLFRDIDNLTKTKSNLYEYNGEWKTISELSEIFGVSELYIKNKIDKGFSIDKIKEFSDLSKDDSHLVNGIHYAFEDFAREFGLPVTAVTAMFTTEKSLQRIYDKIKNRSR